MFRLPELVTIFIAIVPIVEVRGAIPIATGMGIPPVLGGLYAFIGSSAIVPILLLVLLPFINWLGRTRLFKKAAAVLVEKFEKKSRGMVGGEDAVLPQADQTGEQIAEGEKARKKREWKKFWGVFAFVAIPLPLTGVWTGSAVAAITKLKFPKACLAVILGNLVASAIITTLCALLPAFVINYIILAIGIVAVAVVVTLIVKIILHKSDKPNQKTGENKSEDK